MRKLRIFIEDGNYHCDMELGKFSSMLRYISNSSSLSYAKYMNVYSVGDVHPGY